MTATTCDVCIIGGGPGGLATALALIRALPGIQVKVFERAKAFRPLGAGVGIEVNGLKAIEAIDPTLEAWFVRNGYFQRASVTYDHQGKELRSSKIDFSESLEKYGKAGTMMGWYEVQLALFRALPPGTVSLDTRFESYEEDSEGVTVHFQGGMPGAVRAKVLVGADGYFSGVRQQCLDDGPPNFGGTVVWRARVPLAQPMEHMCWYFGAEKVGFIYPISCDTGVWTFSAPLRLVQEAGVDFDPADGGRLRASTQAIAGSNTNALERCLKVFEGYPASCMDRIKGTDPSTVTEHGIFTRPAESLPPDGWGRGRVTLVGDAAHPVRPTGQGLNLTFEDAAELAWHVQQMGLTPAALRAFEVERVPRVGVIVQKAEEQGKAAYNKDAAVATVSNRRFDLAHDYTEFRCGKDFRPLVQGEARAGGGTPVAAGISREGMHTAAQAPGRGPETAESPVLTPGVAHAPGGAPAACRPACKKEHGRQRTIVLVAATGVLAASLAILTFQR